MKFDPVSQSLDESVFIYSKKTAKVKKNLVGLEGHDYDDACQVIVWEHGLLMSNIPSILKSLVFQ